MDVSKDYFIEIPYIISNLDGYYIRSSILNALTLNLNLFNGKLLDLGCGKMPYKKYILENSNVTDYIGLDIETAIEYSPEIKPDIRWDGVKIPFTDDEFDTIIMTDVMEHLSYPVRTLNEAGRVLKMDGVLFFTVPFIWPLHETPFDEYRYTPFALTRIFREAGFSELKLYAMGGWHASLAQMLGLWVRRSNMSKSKRKYLSILLKPVIRYLIKKDRKPVHFGEGQMITGLSGVASKSIIL
jgi:SAM-dependent methyltransferase